MTDLRKNPNGLIPYWNGAPSPVTLPAGKTVPGREGDAPLGRPERPCSRCGKPFAQTLRRRMLCQECFAFAREQGL